MLRAARYLMRRRGDRRWDLLIRSTGVLALTGIPIVSVFPRSVPLVWLAILALPANSPLSPILPAAFEPLIMEAAKYEAAIWVSFTALGAYMLTEYLNWHMYSWVLSWRALTGLKERRWIQQSIRGFSRAPFFTVVVFAITPLPFWAGRCLAILQGYSLQLFLLATAVGRFPRYLAYAWLGAAFKIPTLVLVGVIVGSTAVAVVHRLVQRKPLLADAVTDAAVTTGSEEIPALEMVDPIAPGRQQAGDPGSRSTAMPSRSGTSTSRAAGERDS